MSRGQVHISQHLDTKGPRAWHEPREEGSVFASPHWAAEGTHAREFDPETTKQEFGGEAGIKSITFAGTPRRSTALRCPLTTPPLSHGPPLAWAWGENACSSGGGPSGQDRPTAKSRWRRRRRRNVGPA